MIFKQVSFISIILLSALLWHGARASGGEVDGIRTHSHALRAESSAALHVGARFADCRDCPEMVVIPAGEFLMGSPDNEVGRGKDEGPQQAVNFAVPFAVSRFEITRNQYERFVHATGHRVSGGCITDRRAIGKWEPDPRTTFRDPGYPQTRQHPVACVSWYDAHAYAEWLSLLTGLRYRLLSEAEWEYVARAGSAMAYPWGPDAAQGCRFMNGSDLTARRKYASLEYVSEFGSCDDGSLNTARVGSYLPNQFGIFDMIGNVGEWVEDCSGPYRAKAQRSTSEKDCQRRVVRGGSWGTIARQLRTAERVNQVATDLDDSIGIRVAADLH